MNNIIEEISAGKVKELELAEANIKADVEKQAAKVEATKGEPGDPVAIAKQVVEAEAVMSVLKVRLTQAQKALKEARIRKLEKLAGELTKRSKTIEEEMRSLKAQNDQTLKRLFGKDLFGVYGHPFRQTGNLKVRRGVNGRMKYPLLDDEKELFQRFETSLLKVGAIRQAIAKMK